MSKTTHGHERRREWRTGTSGTGEWPSYAHKREAEAGLARRFIAKAAVDQER